MKILDNNSWESVDMGYVLDRLETITPYGKEYKDGLKPFFPGEEEGLIEELEIIEDFVKLIKEERIFFINIKNIFYNIKDLRHSVKRAIEGYVLTLVELFENKNFILQLKKLKGDIDNSSFHFRKDMMINEIINLENTFDPRGEGLNTFYIYDEYSEELKRIRVEKKFLENRIASEKKIQRDNIKKAIDIKINLDNTIIVSKSDLEKIKTLENHDDIEYNSETYMNIKYALKDSDTINNLKREMEYLKEREENEEFNIRDNISKKVSDYSKELFNNIEAIGRIDFRLAKAYMAISINGVKPKVVKDHVINIVNGRHLKVEEILRDKRQMFTPISVNLNDGVTLITGANMGGKTVSLKLIGNICSMAQCGMFVPCDTMELGLSSFIHISVGDSQSYDMGLSTFGAEIKGIKESLKNANNRGIILIDELARGTNPKEGYAISKAIINHLKDKKSITVITTHYDNLSKDENILHLQVVGLKNIDYNSLKAELDHNKNYGIDMVTKYMDYRLMEVKSVDEVPRDALNIAKLMGLDEGILLEAKRVMEES